MRIAISLLVLAVSLSNVHAEVRTDTLCTSSNNGIVVQYNTGSGVSVTQQSGGAAASYDPDGLPGHQFFHQIASISGSSIVTSGTADLPHGIVRAAGAVGPNTTNPGTGLAGTTVQILDNITFNNTTGQPATVTVNWLVEGSVAVTDNQGFSRGNYHHDLRIEGPGLLGRFVGGGGRDNGQPGSASTDASGWQTSSCEPISGGFGGFNCHGTLSIPTGEFTVSYYALILADARGDAPSSVNFGNTGALTFTLPQGVSFTSRDGTLNAGSRMVNIASRARINGGDNIAIGGFIITGNAPKKVIIRGIGPSLKNVGVTGAMDDPTLELKDLTNNTVLATNDNWADTQQTEIQNSGLAPTNNFEAAIIRTLNPGVNYSAALRGKNDGQGIGLVEIYDLDSAAESKLANISTRAFVQGGDNVLIGGIIGGGNGSQPKVLIRAIGPSLTPFGVPNALPDPILELHDKNGALIATNDDWQTDQAAAIQATGLAPSHAKESAILATLLPTNYTAIVKGANNGTGVGLVEVYHLQ